MHSTGPRPVSQKNKNTNHTLPAISSHTLFLRDSHVYGVHKIYILHVPMTLEFSQQEKGKLAFSLFSQKIPNASKFTKLKRFKTNIPKTSDQANPLSHVHPSIHPHLPELDTSAASRLLRSDSSSRRRSSSSLSFNGNFGVNWSHKTWSFFPHLSGIIPEKHGHLQGCHPPSS